MLGSGPFTNSSGSGYYSVEEYRDILRHAVSRHVEVVPEFDMPSHSHAALKSMERRYKRLREANRDKTEEGITRYSRYASCNLLQFIGDAKWIAKCYVLYKMFIC
jgi:N-acetyl-beta-hexosaminidase